MKYYKNHRLWGKKLKLWQPQNHHAASGVKLKPQNANKRSERVLISEGMCSCISFEMVIFVFVVGAKPAWISFADWDIFRSRSKFADLHITTLTAQYLDLFLIITDKQLFSRLLVSVVAVFVRSIQHFSPPLNCRPVWNRQTIGFWTWLDTKPTTALCLPDLYGVTLSPLSRAASSAFVTHFILQEVQYEAFATQYQMSFRVCQTTSPGFCADSAEYSGEWPHSRGLWPSSLQSETLDEVSFDCLLRLR